MSYGMLIDLKKCVGCHACSVACKASNGTPPGVMRTRVLREAEGAYPNTVKTIMPVLCNHCEFAPCVAACSSGATQKGENGIVTVDKNECTGCGTCMAACPYDARDMIENENGYFGEELNEYEQVAYVDMPEKCVDKCDMCLKYREAGNEQPACVKACMAEARVFGELEEVKKMVKERGGDVYLPESGNSPRVFYLPVVNA